MRRFQDALSRDDLGRTLGEARRVSREVGKILFRSVLFFFVRVFYIKTRYFSTLHFVFTLLFLYVRFTLRISRAAHGYALRGFFRSEKGQTENSVFLFVHYGSRAKLGETVFSPPSLKALYALYFG